MPPKTYTCKICGEEVSKRQSYAVEGGRACRIHEEVQTEAKQRLTEERQKKQAEIDERKNKKLARQEKLEAEKNAHLMPHCFICGKEGLRQDEFYMRWLIEQEKYEMTTGHVPNIFDPVEMSEAIGTLKNVRCLNYVRWAGKNKTRKVDFQTYQTIQMMEQMFTEAVLLVCPKCCQKKQFITVAEERMKNAPKLDDLIKFATVYDNVVKPIVQTKAAKELAAASDTD